MENNQISSEQQKIENSVNTALDVFDGESIHPPQKSITQIKELVRVKKTREAIVNTRALCSEFKSSYFIWDLLGVLYNNNNELDNAIQAFSTALSISPNYPNGLLHLSTTLNKKAHNFYLTENLEEARSLYEKSTTLNLNNPFAFNNLGTIYQRLGKLQKAIEAYAKAVVLKPDYFDALFNLGAALQKDNKLNEALDIYQRILSLNIKVPEVFNNAGNILQHLDKVDESIEYYKEAVALKPEYAEGYLNFGNALTKKFEFKKAITLYKKVLEINPNSIDALINLGAAFNAIKEKSNAINVLEKALSIEPDCAEALNNLGLILNEKGDFLQAKEKLTAAVSIKPKYPDAWLNLGNSCKNLGMLDEALNYYRQANLYNPNMAEPYVNMGLVFAEKVDSKNSSSNLSNLNTAIDCYQEALRIDPNYILAHNNLGNSLRFLGRHSEALELFQKTVSLDPEYREAYLNMANVLQDMGRSEDAESTYRKAITLDPDFSDAFSNMLFCMSYNDKYEMDHIVEQHLLFSEQFEKDKSDKLANFKNDNSENRSLNIGFVSADFRHHVVADFFIPILAALKEQTDLKLFAYYNYFKEDSRTAETKNYMNTWRSIWGKSDEDAKAIIKSDKIDILFDLSGHTAYNRLPLFAEKPAPIQVSWLGYQFTTGLKSMDYYIGNKFAVPSGKYDHHFSEKIVGLPFNPAYIPHVTAPKISNPPILKNNFITFASFFNTLKINSDVLSVWSRILNEIPSSRLAMGGMIGGEVEQRFKDYFRSQNISLDRIDFIQKVNYEKFLSLHNEVDLCLAPFPNTGGSTIFSSLWMGVPTIVLLGKTYFTRGSASIMHLAGLSQFVAADVEDYVAKAHMFAKDTELLYKIRTQLPKTLPDSSLCDPKLYAETLNTALRQMWKTWCSGKKPQAFEI